MMSPAITRMASWHTRRATTTNRTDRLYAIVEELRARAPRCLRAAEIARRFEVSVRTIERDLWALQQAGVPIWSQPGPGGGYSLDPATTLPPLNLTPDEATAVAVALAGTSPMPFASAGRSALQKLTAVMSSRQLDAATALADRVLLAGSEAAAPSPEARVVEEALRQSRAVEIDYHDREGRATTRTVEPAALLRGHGGWYLVGWCRLRGDGRGFRLDRISRARLTDETVTPRAVEDVLGEFPPGFRRPALGRLANEE
jgi:predicted DNA-binding transcriptional regulator YafY